ncbi:hypothetical protein NUW58_g1822 [Xylaria curta]|uniref:Uncharacterized protein n=1 Tax=Xylaria curta TaxID=42375 RepID=A0ACC1PK88_9PEZI|nr:hypothetical protein NUW58_g1822 [Xylaria curta]
MTFLMDSKVLSTFGQHGKPHTVLDLGSLAALGFALAFYLLKGTPWNRPDPYHRLWFERPQFKDGFQSNQPAAIRNIAEQLEQTNQEVVIFWGSQSGTAEIFALKLARECHIRYGIKAMAVDLSDYDSETISQIPETKLAIFILSTFGEGDPSDNAGRFWELLRKESSELFLPSLHYAAFGLGNSNYKYYNNVVDVIVDVFNKAGAKAFMPVGKADDANGGTEENYLMWKADLLSVLGEKLNRQERDNIYIPTLVVREDPLLKPIDLHNGTPIEQSCGSKTKAPKISSIQALTVTQARELYNTPKRNCIHLELDLGSHSQVRYKTGDYLAVYPIAPDEEVDGLLNALGWQENGSVPLIISVCGEGATPKIPSPTCANALLRHYIDICGPVARDVVKDLAQFAPTPESKDLLLGLGKSKTAYYTFTNKNHVTLGRLLSLAAPGAVWKDLPLSYLLDTLPTTRPRYYSIASSSVISAQRLAITVGVETRPLPEEPSTDIKGLTSNYLLAIANAFSKTESLPLYQLTGPAGVLEGHKIHAAIRKSKFKLPTLPTTLIVMFAAGTGIAVFRGFIQERARLKSIGRGVGQMILFFGCRNPEEDFLYHEELEKARKELGRHFEIVTAFSRVPGREGRYVQDVIRHKAEEFSELMNKDASLYVCGRASMAREVTKAVQDVLMAQNGWNQTKLDEWSDSMKRGNKWFDDVWG